MTSINTVNGIRPDFISIQCDVNGTLVLADTTKGINTLISEVAGQAIYKWDKDHPAMSYKEYIQTVVFKGDKYDPTLKKQQEEKLSHFLEFLTEENHALKESVLHLYHKLAITYLDPKTNRVNFTLFPALVELVKKINLVCASTFTIRTFGHDGVAIKNEFNAVAQQGAFGKKSFELHQQGKFKELGLQMEGETEIRTGEKLFRTLQETNILGQDDVQNWFNHKREAAAGKLVYCAEDGKFEGRNVLTIFLDDNLSLPKEEKTNEHNPANPHEQNIAFPVDIYGRPTSWKSRGVIGVRVEPTKAAVNKNYLIEIINQELIKRGYAPLAVDEEINMDRSIIQLNSTHELAWKGSFSFIQMADCQLGFYENNVSWEKEKDLLRKSILKINELQPRFVILCGDLTHARPQEENYLAQVADYKQIVSEIDPSISLICVCGNHDIGDRPTHESIAAYQSHFSPQFFSFWVGGVHCVALNSSLLCDSSGAPELFQEQYTWLNQELERTNYLNPKQRFIFSHHSWCLVDPQEEDNHFVIPKTFRLKLLELFAEKGVTACFSGHYHRNAQARYKKIELITTGPIGKHLGEDPSGFRLVKVTSEGISHTYQAL